MPIAKEIKHTPTEYKPDPVVPIPYQSAVVNAKQMHPNNLLTYTEGPTLRGSYYKLVLDKDNDLAGHMLGRDPVLQQYIKITNLESKLISDVNFSQEEETRLFDGSITVLLFPCGIIPNVGDMYVIDSAADVPIIYQVTKPAEAKSIYKQTCYELSMTPIDFSNGKRIEDLDLKVVESRVFVREFLQYGNNPVVNHGVFESMVELADMRKMAIKDYFARYYSRRLRTFILPDQTYQVYDPYLVNFILESIESTDMLDINQVIQYNTGYAGELEHKSILQCLINPEQTPLSFIFTKAGRVNRRFLGNTLVLGSIIMSTIEEVIYPVNPIYNVDASQSMRLTSLVIDTPIAVLGDKKPKYIEGFQSRSSIDLTEPPAVNPICTDFEYIFSQSFYDGTPTSLMEEVTLEYLKQLESKPNTLIALLNHSRTWNNLERFYYVPILALLIKRIVRKL